MRKTFEGENFPELVKIRFSWRKLQRIVRFCHAKGHHIPNFAEKTFAYSHKTAKFTKVFSLESFPLYGRYHICQQPIKGGSGKWAGVEVYTAPGMQVHF